MCRAVAAPGEPLADAPDRSDCRRDADASHGVVHGRDLAEDTGPVEEEGIVEARDDRDAVRRQIFVVQRPAPFEIDQALAGAVTAGVSPGVFSIDPVRGGVEVSLVGVSGIVGRRDRWRFRFRLDVGQRHGGPLTHGLDDVFRVRASGQLDGEVRREVRWARAPVGCPRLLREASDLLRRFGREQRDQRDAFVLLGEPAPCAALELL